MDTGDSDECQVQQEEGAQQVQNELALIFPDWLGYCRHQDWRLVKRGSGARRTLILSLVLDVTDCRTWVVPAFWILYHLGRVLLGP